jgi:cytochrome oxidase assembly protein ShyY1
VTVGRLLLTRRWVGLTLLAAVMVGAFALLGDWQFGRSYRVSDGYSEEPVALPVAALDRVGTELLPGSVGRQAIASGRYDAARQQLVGGHELDGAAVLWVVTPMTLADGSMIDVVRGWATKADAGLDVPPAGLVQVTGRLEAAGAGVSPPTGSTARAGYLVRTAQSPPDPLSLQPVPSKPTATTSGGSKEFHLQNAVYTSQWWIFAVLVVVYWWRLLRDERSLHGATS